MIGLMNLHIMKSYAIKVVGFFRRTALQEERNSQLWTRGSS